LDRVVRGHLTEVFRVAISPNGRTLASYGKDGSIYLWDLAKPPRHLGYQTLPSRLFVAPQKRQLGRNFVFTSDSQSIVGVDWSGGVAIWDALTLKETRRLQGEFTNQGILISPDTRWVVEEGPAGCLGVWEVRSGLESTHFKAAPERLAAARFTRNGRFLVTFFGPATNLILDVWNMADWRRKASSAFHFTSDWDVFTTSLPDSCVIDAEHAFHFLDVTKLNEAPKLIGNPGDTVGMDTSSDGRIFAVAYIEGPVRLWDMTTLQPLDTLRSFVQAPMAVAFTPDGRRMAVCSAVQQAVKLWDAGTRQEVLTLSGTGRVFNDLKFSPDGRYLMAVDSAGLACIWFAPTWAEIDAAEKAETATVN
jgi:WD40 repeat protein